MITHRTKLQLLVFAIITLLGVSFAGARYARLDRLFLDDHYTVVGHFLSSGGIYTGGEVSYRGVKVGQVGAMKLTHDGVDVSLDIDNKYDKIPSDALAVVGNRSAVGEQYVELQPQTDAAPYLRDGSEIAPTDTRTPLPTEKLLADAADTVSSVNTDDLSTTVSELGKAFGGAGDDLQQILDTSNSFVKTADDNFDVTSALIRDGNTVLSGQVASEGSLRTFARDLSLFSGTLAGSDADLRKLLVNGSAGAQEVQAFLQANKVDLTELLSESVTTGDIVLKHLPGLRQVLVLYPYVVEGGFTVLDKNKAGHYDAHFGLVLTPAKLCKNGYQGTVKRPPQDGANKPMNTDARCAESASQSNARGAQNLNRPAPGGSTAQAPVVGAYDSATGELQWGDPRTASGAPSTLARQTPGKDTWKWLYLRSSTTLKE
ncbi:MlaD family protein [Nocardioides sp. CER19]|uniref:MlaD family protein n=1 Tax=Nocardioides sp. CER19 TaxID=3038538 RepID=UPI00244D7957|nr:MlaD family protein [Nocardioides sp. CER19]MDH2414525.1 MlaD family protein [Nocardioides sp. CER19]